MGFFYSNWSKKSWRLVILICFLIVAAYQPHLALARTATPTFTLTPTVTFTLTPTDSLNVFESPTPTATATPDQVSLYIASPQNGEVLRGEVQVLGKNAVAGFVSSQVEFSYIDNPTETWFLIQKNDSPVNNGLLAVWNTSNLADGRYNMRLKVFLQGGEVRYAVVNNVLISNYSAIPTSRPEGTSTPETPVSSLPIATLTALPSPSATPQPKPTPTPLPRNPASLSTNELIFAMGRATLAVVAFFAIFGILMRARQNRR